MEIEQIKSIIESILFAAGRAIKITEFMSVLELGKDEIMPIMENLINEYKAKERGIEIIKINDGFQMCTKKENMNIYTKFLINVVNQIYQMQH